MPRSREQIQVRHRTEHAHTRSPSGGVVRRDDLRGTTAAGEPSLSPAGRRLMARRKARVLSSTTQWMLRRSQNKERDTLLRGDLRESEREGRNKPQTWQPARVRIVFLRIAIVVRLKSAILILDRNHDRSRRQDLRGDLDASLGQGLDAYSRATKEPSRQPRERCQECKRRTFPGSNQPLNHVLTSILSRQKIHAADGLSFESRQPGFEKRN